MWFIFPRFVGLGHSAMAKRFALSSRDEAVPYLIVRRCFVGSRIRRIHFEILR
jgi:uncharacterized protein (DUF1810 family)